MALNLGELVAGLRADDAPFTRSLSRAELAMRGLTRDVNGQLRDLNGRFVRDGDAMGRSLSWGIGNGARQAVSALAKVGPAVAAIGVGLPAIAAVTTGLLGLAAGAVAAGLAVKAFTLAAQPQLDSVTEVADLAAEAQKAVADGAADAAEKQKAYKDALADLPPATQATAKAFVGLKKDYASWSDEMSGTTMPVFTKGIGILRDLLPTLTPFVTAAAEAIGGFLDEVAVGVKSAGFKQWAADMSAAAGPALRDFLTVIRNLAIGFGGLLQAFLPVSGQMTGGLVAMSDAFARWGAGLKDSGGFAQFMELAREGGATLGELALAVGKLLVALGPLIGITTQVALALARVVNALPPGVLSTLATLITGVVIGMKLWAAGSRVVAAANALMASSAWATIAAWTRMAASSIASYTRIAAAAVASAARTAAAWAASAARATATFLATMIRVAAVTVARFTLMAARAVIWAATMAASWLAAFWPIALIGLAVAGLVALIIMYWDEIKAWTITAWDWIVGKILWAKDMLITLFLNFTLPGLLIKHWQTIRDTAVAAWNALITWFRTIPARIGAAIAGLALTLYNAATKAFTSFRNAAAAKVTSFLAWAAGIPGRISRTIGSLGGLLVSKGKDVVRGLWNGISSMGGWLAGRVKSFVSNNVVSAAKSFLHIGSPSKLMASAIGRWIPAGIAQGAVDNVGVLDRAMASLVNTPTPSAAMAMAGGATAAGGSAPGGGSSPVTRVDLSGSVLGELLIGEIRKAVGDRGGDVQLVLGR